MAPLTTKGLAQLLNISVWIVKRWRREGLGPRFFRLPGSKLVRYDPADVEGWLATKASNYRQPVAGDGKS